MAKKLFKCGSSKIRVAFLLAFLINMSVFAQEKYTLTGVVTMASLNQPASGVSVIIKGSDVGTVTDFDGNYAIEVAEGDILEFVYLGFQTENVIVTGQRYVDVSLLDDTQKLDEIVVVGYGTQKAKTVTGAVSKVSGNKLQQSSVARVDDALVGRVSGVQIQAANAEAGGDTRITIRGAGSISGDSAPLVVVDGIPLGTDPDILGTIDANTIKSVDILKDASSTAIYGSRGANGVILITLKDGVEGKTTYSYNTYFGVKWADNNDFYDFTIDDQEEYLLGVKAGLDETDVLDQIVLDKVNIGLSGVEASRIVADAFGGETNWQDVIIPGGTINSHSFSVSGGDKRTKYAASLSYLHDEGILINDDFKKYNGRVKVDITSKNKKFKVGASIAGTRTIQERTGTFRNYLRQPSFLGPYITEDVLNYVNLDNTAQNISFTETPPEVGDYSYSALFENVFFDEDGDGVLDRNEDGSVRVYNGGDEENEGNINISTTNGANPIAIAQERDRFKYQNSFRFNSYAEYKIAKGFKIRQNLFGDTRNTRSTNYQSVLFDTRAGRATREEQNDTRDHFGTTTLLTYKRDLKRHTIDATAGAEYEYWEYGRQEIIGTGFENDATQNIPIGIDATAETLLGQDVLQSYFSRLSYDYDDKYLFSISARTDGSSRFGENTKFGFFPAASIGWNVANENFLKHSNFLTSFKLRASYGVSGSNVINSDIFLNLYRYQETYAAVTYNGEQGVKATTIANPDLSWERLIEFSPGLDMELGNGALGVTFDYYERTSDDLILEQPIGSAYGTPTALDNVGEVKNSGYELELRSRLFNKSNFQWNISATATTNENEVTEFVGIEEGEQGFITALADPDRPVEFITEIGGPITAFYGYVYDSDINLVYINSPFDRPNSANQRVRVKDLNGDGLIDEDDRTVLGDPYPDLVWSLTNNFNFYNFDLSFLIQGSHGAQVRTLGLADIRQELTNDNAVVILESEYETTNGTTINVPEELREVENADELQFRYLTSDHIQDASYVALRNVNLGYTFPSDVTDKLKLSKLRFYVTGENLVYATADGFFGFNPEDLSFTSDNANDPNTLGVQRVSLPIAKTVSFGVNVDF